MLRAACWVGKLMNYSPVCFMMSSGHALPRNVCVGAATAGQLQSQWAGGNLGSVPTHF